ncbi:MAG: hypothetical protein ACPHGY_08905, partial [Rhodospirillaceae bacterium]
LRATYRLQAHYNSPNDENSSTLAAKESSARSVNNRDFVGFFSPPQPGVGFLMFHSRGMVHE